MAIINLADMRTRCPRCGASSTIQSAIDMRDVVTIDDDVADIDADAEGNPVGVAVSLRHLGLNADRAVDGVYGAGELDQHAVASGLYDPSIVCGNCRIDDLAPERLQGGQRADFIGAH